MNKVILTGRITKDLELKQTASGKDLTNYSIAVAVDKDTTEFINCTTFGESAKTITTYCNKGDLILVEGTLRTNQYVDKEDKKHTNTYVLTNRVEFLNTKKKDEPVEEPIEKSIEKSAVEITEDDLPF